MLTALITNDDISNLFWGAVGGGFIRPFISAEQRIKIRRYFSPNEKNKPTHTEMIRMCIENILVGAVAGMAGASIIDRSGFALFCGSLGGETFAIIRNILRRWELKEDNSSYKKILDEIENPEITKEEFLDEFD